MANIVSINNIKHVLDHILYQNNKLASILDWILNRLKLYLAMDLTRQLAWEVGMQRHPFRAVNRSYMLTHLVTMSPFLNQNTSANTSTIFYSPPSGIRFTRWTRGSVPGQRWEGMTEVGRDTTHTGFKRTKIYLWAGILPRPGWPTRVLSCIFSRSCPKWTRLNMSGTKKSTSESRCMKKWEWNGRR